MTRTEPSPGNPVVAEDGRKAGQATRSKGATWLLADIGGTNTRVCLAQGGQVRPDTILRYLNASHSGLEPILRDYIERAGKPDLEAACIDLAGPVSDGVGEMTNLSWVIPSDMVAWVTGAQSVAVINDLQAMGHAMGHIADADLVPVISGTLQPGAAQLVVNIGTGFNAVLVASTPAGRLVPAAEAGHVSLPVGNHEEWLLAQALVASHGHASVEEVLSGRGIGMLYGWYAGLEGAGRPLLDAAGTMAAVAKGDDPVALQAAALFLRMLGRVTGDLALTHLPFGGIWFVGGVARHVAPLMAASGTGQGAVTDRTLVQEFQRGFRDKGRFSDYMSHFSGSVVTDDFAALRGCTAYLAQMTKAAAQAERQDNTRPA